ncbi:hypothetical protein ORI89_06375 [Sphingobacterium sp. UT-1RO-CII-1]|uniref:AbiTii domain-containing protein n=1 Tax=Sphingobacterium sp. UT-1RO-CII-1 TaxID=2995225 RepID=UPI00227B1DB9|nr:hypothetical protein [Sphingobacterium sp. UT-1RO-CII-1]MCY4779267.1 hypothetical protein [Sphingobacterium sp. UT-1RO-CII-1]
MKLLELIINELAINNVLISEPLLKTKVLASRIKNSYLLEWVNSELNGYSEDTNLPDYRVEYGVLIGNYINNGFQISNAQIPVPNISKEFKDLYTKIENRDSIEAVSNLVGKDNLAFSVSNDRRLYLENELRSLGYSRFQILNLHIQTPVNFFSNIVSNVRSKLLEFMLQLEQEFGIEADLSDLAKNNQIINQIMNTTINNSGDGAIINNGDNNKVDATIKIHKNDKESLREKLLSENIQSEDVSELLEVLDIIKPVSKNNYGPKVNIWIQKMLGKALDGSWKIGIGAAGTLLADCINSYYGL